MKFYNNLEKKFGKYAVRNFMTYIIVMYAVGMMVVYFKPAIYTQYFALDAGAILHGQVWRIFTFMIYPPSTDLLYFIIMMYLYYFIGNALEAAWGAFSFNMYFFTGVLGHVVGALLVYLIFGQTYYLTTSALNLSLFMAFAATYPDEVFLLFWIIPIKAKWLGILDAALFAYNFFQGGIASKLCIGLSVMNFVIYFFLFKNRNRISPKEIKRRVQYKRSADEGKVTPTRSRHRCAVCGRTEFDDPNLEFRYCSKCEGAYEYCSDHLYTHVHVKKDDPQKVQ